MSEDRVAELERALGRYFAFYLSELAAWSREIEGRIAERDAARLGCLGSAPGMLWP